jgi:sulfur-carrier protein
MKVNIRYFASIREALGSSEQVDVAEGTTLAVLRDQLIASSNAHAGALACGRALRCAINQSMCAETAVIPEGAEVAFFPPVTGG